MDCIAGAIKWGQNYDLSIFQVLHNNGAFLGLENNSLIDIRVVLIFYRRPGWSGKMTKITEY